MGLLRSVLAIRAPIELLGSPEPVTAEGMATVERLLTDSDSGSLYNPAVIRGLGHRGTDRLGNFWVDLIRTKLYVLLPLAAAVSISASVRESDRLTNFVELLLMLLVPAAFTATFGRMINRRRQGWALYAAMIVMFVGGTAVMYAAEAHGTPTQRAAAVNTHLVAGSTGGNMEGKEQRFGIAGSSLFVSSGTASGDGAVDSSVESFTGLGAAVAMANMMTGEVIFGGPGSGRTTARRSPATAASSNRSPAISAHTGSHSPTSPAAG